MKIVEHTPQRLVVEDRPRIMAGLVWFMGGLCLWVALSGQTDGMAETLLVAALGLGALAMAHHSFPFQRLTFDRASGTLTRTEARLTGRKSSTLPLAEISRAALQAQWSENARLERLVLVGDQGKLPMEYGFTSAPRAQLVQRINDWLDDAHRP